ncbi:hypothetical protein D3C77_245380 [compost metagenome]
MFLYSALNMATGSVPTYCVLAGRYLTIFTRLLCGQHGFPTQSVMPLSGQKR